MTSHVSEIQRGQRFEFGKNWQRFLRVLNGERITEAEKSLCSMLETKSFSGKSFLDVGSGSGLFSLAALRLGAARVHSLDYDPQSVACTRELKQRYFPDADHWTIEEGSVLDAGYLARLGQFDIVYSWGVLHHTGSMWQALENVVPLIDRDGLLFIAIYNSQIYWTSVWTRIKSAYTRSPRPAKWLIFCGVATFLGVRCLIHDLTFLRNPLRRYLDYKKSRGMSMFHDWVDWVGGYPFEAAKPEEIFDFCRGKGFVLLKLRTCGGRYGNNEFVFQKCAE